jgi:TonB family protein
MRALLIGGSLALACAGAGASSNRATLAPQGLSEQEIQEVVQAKMKVIEGCAVIAEATSGSLTISFQIAPSGAVDDVDVIDSSVDNAALESCLVRTFEKMKFPTADTSTRSEFPFRLRSK